MCYLLMKPLTRLLVGWSFGRPEKITLKAARLHFQAHYPLRFVRIFSIPAHPVVALNSRRYFYLHHPEPSPPQRFCCPALFYRADRERVWIRVRPILVVQSAVRWGPKVNFYLSRISSVCVCMCVYACVCV